MIASGGAALISAWKSTSSATVCAVQPSFLATVAMNRAVELIIVQYNQVHVSWF